MTACSNLLLSMSMVAMARMDILVMVTESMSPTQDVSRYPKESLLLLSFLLQCSCQLVLLFSSSEKMMMFTRAT